ncbi:MAG: phage tail tape measure protein [Candidatus Microthrix sp.]|nr:phage tail tape measure protein [Candidatus Microthrix sp.]
MARSRRLEVVIAGDAKGALAAMGAVDRRAGGLGGSFKAVGTAAVAGFAVVGAAAVGAGAALYAIGSSFDSAYDKIRVNTGATGEELGRLQQSFRDVVRTVPTDFGAASEAISGLNQRLGLTGQPLEAVSRRMLELSRLTETDLNTNVQNLTRVFGDWGIEAGQMPATMDQLFRATQQSGVGMDQLSAQVVQFGAPLRNLGFSFSDSVAMLSQFEAQGVNTTTVMSGMRQGLKNFAAQGEEPAVAFRRFAEGVQNGTYDMTDAMAVFGARAGADMFAAISEGRFDFDALSSSIENGSDTIMDASRDTRDFGEQWQLIKNRVFLALEPVATRVFAAVGDGMTRLGPIVEDLARWFQEEIPPAMARVQEIFEQVWPRVREAFVGAMSAVSSWWADNGPGIMAFLGQLGETFRAAFDAVKLIVERVFGVISNLWDRFGNQWLAKVQTAFSAITQAFRGVMDIIKGILDVFVGVFTGDWSRAWDGVKGIFRGAWNVIVGVARAAINAVSGIIGAGMAVISMGWGYAWRGIRGVFTRVWDGIKSGVGRAIDAVKGTIRGGVSAIGDIWNGIKSAMTGPLNWVIDNVINRFLGVMRTVAGVVNLGGIIPGNIPHVGGDSGSGGGPRRLGLQLHSGGVVGETGGRTHRGPLRPGEVPAVLQTGETVVDRRGMVAGRPAADVLAERYGIRSDTELRALGLPVGGFPNPVSHIAGIASDAVNAVADRLRDLAAGGLARLLDPVRSAIGSAGAQFGTPGKVFAGMVNKPIDALLMWVAGATNEAQKRAAPVISGSGMAWQQMWNAVHHQFPDATLHSGFRPGAITATGRLSRHALGRAIDVSPRMDIFDWIARTYPNAYELIFSPAGGRQLYHGSPHVYGEPTRGDHWDHVHWSMADGGLGTVRKPTAFIAGDAGPEDFAFAPLSRGGLRTQTAPVEVHVHVAGSVLSERDLVAALADALRRGHRGGELERLIRRVAGN